MMGLYPTCPGVPYYDIGTPLFDKINIHTGSQTFTIKAENRSATHLYIQSATLNGKPFNKAYLLHEEIIKGGTLVLVMGSEPNKAWGRDVADTPY
jgi:putative alpha-1,2-mannosidase